MTSDLAAVVEHRTTHQVADVIPTRSAIPNAGCAEPAVRIRSAFPPRRSNPLRRTSAPAVPCAARDLRLPVRGGCIGSRGSASNFMPTANRSGTSLKISPATSPRRPCVFTTRASVMNSALVSGSRMVRFPARCASALKAISLPAFAARLKARPDTTPQTSASADYAQTASR